MKNKISRNIHELKVRIRAVSLALRHPGIPVYARWVGVLVLAYALSPVDLIPDWIPVLGHLDDLLIVPLGLFIFVRMIPRPVWDACLCKAREELKPPPASTSPPTANRQIGTNRKFS